MVDVVEKVCSKCGDSLPLSSEFFYRHSGHKDGFNSRCKACHNESVNKYYTDNKDKVKEYHKKYEKENVDKIRDNKRKYRNKNKDYFKEYFNKYRNENKEHLQNYLIEYMKTYIVPQSTKDRMKLWWQNNPDKAREYAHRRRSLLLSLPCDFVAEDVPVLYKDQFGKCYYCGEDLLTKYHLEHKIPITRGGSNLLENVCLSCGTCNHRKHTKTEEEFIPYLLKET